MRVRELRALGVSLPALTTKTTTTATNIEGSKMATIATQVDLFHDNIYLSSTEGKKLYHKATQGLPNDQKYDGDPKDIIKFVERVESKLEDFGWSSVATNFGPNDLDLFKPPEIITTIILTQVHKKIMMRLLIGVMTYYHPIFDQSSHLNPLDMNNSNATQLRSYRTTASIKLKANFQGVPKYAPINIDTLGLRRSPRIAALKRNQLDPTLNHVGFVHVTKTSEEDVNPLKEH